MYGGKRIQSSSDVSGLLAVMRQKLPSKHYLARLAASETFADTTIQFGMSCPSLSFATNPCAERATQNPRTQGWDLRTVPRICSVRQLFPATTVCESLTEGTAA